jgi:hypothetical protein
MNNPLVVTLRDRTGPSLAGFKLWVEDVLRSLAKASDAEFLETLSARDDDGTSLSILIGATATVAEDLSKRLNELAEAIEQREQQIASDAQDAQDPPNN